MSMRMRILAGLILGGLVFSAVCECWAGREPTASQSVANIIPDPVELEVGEGRFVFSKRMRVIASGAARPEADKLIDYLAPAIGYRLKIAEGRADRNAIVLSIDGALKKQLGEEGYKLDVSPKRIDIRAAESAGLFYGIQTLRQLLPAEIFGNEKAEGLEWSVPCVNIVDYPRFGWRGLLIDPARHFIPVEDFKRFVDAMAIHKLNRLQVHFTDRHGWRIEIRKYPKLTEIGSKMDISRRKTEDREYVGGFYTQDDIRALVRYAADRHITIVPERSRCRSTRERRLLRIPNWASIRSIWPKCRPSSDGARPKA